MHFLVQFADLEELWLPWLRDLFASVAYEDYCQSIPALRPLIKSANEAAAWCRAQRHQDITAVSPDTVVFVELRSYGADWYQTLTVLPNLHTHTYLLESASTTTGLNPVAVSCCTVLCWAPPAPLTPYLWYLNSG